MVSVFISYAHEDHAEALAIYEHLRRRGFEPWLDNVDLLAGQDWELEITQAIRRSDFFLVLLSSHSVGKQGFVQKELKKALDIHDLMPEGSSYVIPARLEECQIPERLRHIHYCDLFRGADLCKQLARGASNRRLIDEREALVLSGEVGQGNLRVQYHCSFCGKNQDEVPRLIAGPGAVYICAECIQLCNEIIEEEAPPNSTGLAAGG